VRALIKENKIAQMYSAIQTGARDGMQTLDQCLREMVRKGLVDSAEARMYAENKIDFAA
jgi:twitching motility protein PilT